MSRILLRVGVYSSALFLLALLALLAITGCRQDQPVDPTDDAPAVVEDVQIATVGHGEFIAADGRHLPPSRALFLRTQRGYLDRLIAEADLLGLPVAATRTLIASQVSDELLGNALLIDWLIDELQPVGQATMTAVNVTTRAYYLDRLAPPTLARAERHDTKGLGNDVAQRLAASGIETHVATKNGGERYIQECAAAGVPIPPPMFSSAWDNKGELTDEFLSSGEKAELMQYTSTKPAGVCLGLPRYIPGTDDIDVLGVICLGTVSSKACFWDNPRNTTFKRGVQIDIKEFVGGFDLQANNQGVCSDCHAGENPFVVHPEKPPFAGFSQFAAHWYEPIVHPTWPQNPGPTNLLSGVSSTGRCDSCHSAGLSGGRFPAVSTELAGYCSTVLGSAALDNLSIRTMPPYGADPANFTNHEDALRDACNAPPSTGTVVEVTTKDDPGMLSPPAVIDPLYACATQVSVSGAVLGAKVTLFINGSAVGSVTATHTHEVFGVPALMVGDKVSTQQELGGALSAMSADVIVRDHKVDFPLGLPEPTIDPTLIYECASVIAVRNVPGATITVYSNGGVPRSTGTSTGWTAIGPGKAPFVIGDEFTAEQSLCSDSSKLSAGIKAVAAPGSMPAPTLDPSQTFPGQQLVNFGSLTNGSVTTVGVSGLPAGKFSTPISWLPEYNLASEIGRSLISGDVITAQQKLCVAGPEIKTPPTGKCDELPAPRIFTPIAGNNFVVVWQAIPGARIHVYDAASIEIGDGSGDIIWLSRALTASDVLTVVQQVGECTSKAGYRISVRGNGK